MQVCRDVVKKIEQTFEETVEKWIKKVEKVCEDLPWPLDWFCGLVTTLVKVVERIVKTVVTTVTTVVCVPVALGVKAVAGAVQVALAIPIFGAIVRWVIGLGAFLVAGAAGFVGAGLGLIGIRPIKHLRLHVVILMRPDHTLTVPPDRVRLAIERAESIFRHRADVKIHATVQAVPRPSAPGALTIASSVGLLGEDMTEAGVYFQTTIAEMFPEDNPWFVARIGAPLVAFVVDSVEGTTIGCSAGPLADYVCVEGGQMMVRPQDQPVHAPYIPQPPDATFLDASATLAHEVGHACGLLHDNFLDCSEGDVTNLMFCQKETPTGVKRGDNLSPFQREIIRGSPHVTYV